MINIKSQKFWFNFCSILFLVSLALTPIHTKISGVAWVTFVIFSLIFVYVYRQVRVSSSEETLIFSLKFFLIISLLALLIRWIPQIVLGEFNQASTFNIRVLVIVTLCYFICNKMDAHNHSISLFTLLPYSLLLIGISALVITLPFGENTKFGTHPIPWAAAMSILTVVLHIIMLNEVDKKISSKRFIVLGWLTSIAVLIAILATGKRGSYFYLIWLLFYGLYMLYLVSSLRLSIKNIAITLLVALGILVCSYFLLGEIYLSLWQRIVLGYQEVVLYFEDPIAAANTSVGARLYMWHNSLLNLEGNWLFGLGIEGTENMIKGFASQSNAPMLIGLNQLHNEYLQALVSYGLFGLISFLLYPFGLFISAIKLRKQYPQAFWGLIGIIFLLLTSGMTNTNSYHNYFGTVFSLSIGLVFIVCRLQNKQHP